MNVTVVIPARNAALTIGHQLSALRDQKNHPPFTIIVVNNGSTDGTEDIVGSFPLSNIKIVHEEEAGINRARNRGISEAGDGVVLICDADDVVDTYWVSELTNHLTFTTWVAGVAQIEYVNLNSERTRFVSILPGPKKIPKSRDPFFDDTLGGCCGFHKELWKSVGGFDCRLSGSGDEHEFFMRAHKIGFRQTVVPTALIKYRKYLPAKNRLKTTFRRGRSRTQASLCAGGFELRKDPSLQRNLVSFTWKVITLPIWILVNKNRRRLFLDLVFQIGVIFGHASMRRLKDQGRSFT